MRPYTETTFTTLNDPLSHLHRLEFARVFQERSNRAMTPMSLPSVRATPTAAFDLYNTPLNPSRSEQPTPVIRHAPETHIYHNRTPSYTRATQNLPLPFQSPMVQHHIYNPVHMDGPVKRRFLQVCPPENQQHQSAFRHEKSGSCSSAISSHGSSSLVAQGVASTLISGCQSSPTPLTNHGTCFELKVHRRQSLSSTGLWNILKVFLVW